MKTISILATIAFFTFYASAQECCDPQKTSSARTKKSVSDEKPAKNVANRTSIFEVPLVCPAAPEIGCGSRAKPILRQLEQQEAVSQAWLNRAGTILAVVWKSNSTDKLREQVVSSMSEKGKLTFTELKDKEFQEAFESFTSGNWWYRAAGLDQLSEREAEVIVERLVRRTKAKVSLSGEKTNQLQSALLTLCKEQLTGNTKKNRKSLEDELLQAVGNFLSEKEVAALKEAVALGFRPLANEK